MKVKKYRAATTKEAFARARSELGDEAVLLHQRMVEGDPRLGVVSLVEITAAVDVESGGVAVAEPEVRPFFPPPYAAAQPQPARPGYPLSSPAPARRDETMPSTQPPRRTIPPQPSRQTGPDHDALWQEIRQIRSLLQRQNETGRPLPEPLQQWRTALREAMLPTTTIEGLLLGLEDVLTPSALQRQDMVSAALAQRLVSEIAPVHGAIRCGKPGEPEIFALVGPTGVGKTTTLAKLAAQYTVQHRLPIALVTADTFRIGAVGQLRTYCELIRAPLEVAYTPQDLAGHLARHRDKALILIDTPGRSPTDTEQLERLRAFLGVLQRPHLQVALAAGTLLADARRIVERFSIVQPRGILLTKLDETTLFGPAYALLAELGIPLSYFTTGQQVPEDIEIASNEKLVDRLLQSARQYLEA